MNQKELLEMDTDNLTDGQFEELYKDVEPFPMTEEDKQKFVAKVWERIEQG